MKKFRLNKARIIISVLLILIIAAAFLLINRSGRRALLDRHSYAALTAEITDEITDRGFDDQDALRDYITSEADKMDLSYTADSSGNIIFNVPAAERKKKVSPTIIALSYNYETVRSDASLIASALTIAASDLESGGRRTVILFNNEKDQGSGYRGINRKYFTNKSKTIYLDSGSKASISRSSFTRGYSDVTIPAARAARTCDTEVRVHLSGIEPSVIAEDIDDRPDPFSLLSSMLTRLSSKSVSCELGDIAVGSDGSMCPVSLDISILMNSYSVPSFTSYLDKLIRQWNKKYSESQPEMELSYEITDDQDSLPSRVYSNDTVIRLSNVLYTIKRGSYRYTSDDRIPDLSEEGGISGQNIISGLRAEGKSSLVLEMLSQGWDDACLANITGDNRSAAEYSGCSYSIEEIIPAFSNERDSLSRVLMKTYRSVNNIKSLFRNIRITADERFTPCSYLAVLNSKMDIVHLRISTSEAPVITNMILCYLDTKGNFLML